MTGENHENPNKHESVNDLPSIKKLRRSVSGLKWLGRLLRNDEARKSAREVREELDGLISLVDDFYHLLGDRNWVFSDELNLEGTRARRQAHARGSGARARRIPQGGRSSASNDHQDEPLSRHAPAHTAPGEGRARPPPGALLQLGPRDSHRDGRVRRQHLPVRREEGPPCEGVRRAPCGRLHRDRVGRSPVRSESVYEIDPREDG